MLPQGHYTPDRYQATLPGTERKYHGKTNDPCRDGCKRKNVSGVGAVLCSGAYKVRNAAANGHETLDTDSSAVAEEKGDLACERYVLDNDKLQVEVLANLDKVQPAGAVVIVSYPRIEGATGLPARVWAVTE